MINNSFATEYKAAHPVIFKAGAAINEIVRKNGNVKPDFIAYTDSIKPELLATGFKYRTVTKLIGKLIECLNSAISYAEGNENARQQCLKLSREFDELIKFYSKRGDVKWQ